MDLQSKKHIKDVDKDVSLATCDTLAEGIDSAFYLWVGAEGKKESAKELDMVEDLLNSVPADIRTILNQALKEFPDFVIESYPVEEQKIINVYVVLLL